MKCRVVRIASASLIDFHYVHEPRRASPRRAMMRSTSSGVQGGLDRLHPRRGGRPGLAHAPYAGSGLLRRRHRPRHVDSAYPARCLPRIPKETEILLELTRNRLTAEERPNRGNGLAVRSDQLGRVNRKKFRASAKDDSMQSFASSRLVSIIITTRRPAGQISACLDTDRAREIPHKFLQAFL
jgi:hypothetical protein